MNDKVEDITVQILVSIRDEIRGLRQPMEEEIGTVRAEIETLRRQTDERSQAVESALSELTETLKRFVYHSKGTIFCSPATWRT